MTIKEKEKDELEELYHEAEGRMLERMQFNILDWLDEKETKRFHVLYKKDNGFCYDSTCGDRVNCENCKV